MTYREYLAALDLAKARIQNAQNVSPVPYPKAREEISSALHSALFALKSAIMAVQMDFEPEPGEEKEGAA